MSEATRVARSRTGGGRRGDRYGGALKKYLESIRRYELLTKSGEFRIGTLVKEGKEKAR